MKMKNKIFMLGILALISINTNAGWAKYRDKIVNGVKKSLKKDHSQNNHTSSNNYTQIIPIFIITMMITMIMMKTIATITAILIMITTITMIMKTTMMKIMMNIIMTMMVMILEILTMIIMEISFIGYN